MKTYSWNQYLEAAERGQLVKCGDCMPFIPKGKYVVKLSHIVYPRYNKPGWHLVGSIYEFDGLHVWLWGPWYLGKANQLRILRELRHFETGTQINVFISSKKKALPMARLESPVVVVP